MARKRIDRLLVDEGFFASREQAQLAIRSGWVRLDDRTVDKPGKLCLPGSKIEIKEKPRYVGRGGYKLKGALTDFDLDVAGLTALDAGASTGGFTDCLLQEGARRVYAFDVGKGQLDWKLRQDPRVAVRESFNIRNLSPEDLPEKVELITADLSFISLTKVLPALAKVLKSGGKVLLLIKPQFEAGRAEVKRGGVVRDPEVHRRVVKEIEGFVSRLGLEVCGTTESALIGPAGNKEFFLLAGKKKT